MGVFSKSKGVEKNTKPWGNRPSKGEFGKRRKPLKKKKVKSLTVKVARVYSYEELLDRTITIRWDSKSAIYLDRKRFVFEKGACQLCGSLDLDSPHHALDGISRKDDRTMICVCVKCHLAIHAQGWHKVPKTREEVEAMGWSNNKEYLKRNM